MKNFLIILLLQTGMSAHAKIIPCKENCIAAVAVPEMVQAVVSTPTGAPQDASCPSAGYEVANIASVQGPVLSASSIVQNLLAQGQATLNQMNADQSHCGNTCQEKNLVSSFTTSAPQQIRKDVNCEGQPVNNIQKEMNNSEIENYASQTLKGQTAEGAALRNSCPRPCSFYVASAQTPLSATRSRLNLTVLCNQPRNGSIIFATYAFTAGLIHQWTCAK